MSTGEVEVRNYENCLSEQDAIRFRQQAVEAQERAAGATDLIDKEAWLLIAEDWLELAQAVEARHADNEVFAAMVICEKALLRPR